MKKLLILMLLGVLFVPMNGSAKADGVLYCQTEMATGLYEEKRHLEIRKPHYERIYHKSGWRF